MDRRSLSIGKEDINLYFMSMYPAGSFLVAANDQTYSCKSLVRVHIANVVCCYNTCIN